MEGLIRPANSRSPTRTSCTLWVHEEHSSKDDVIFSKSIFAEGEIGAGDLIELIAAERRSDGKTQEASARPVADATTRRKSSHTQSYDESLGRKGLEETSSQVLDGGVTPSRCKKQLMNPHQRYLFLVPEGNSEQKVKPSNLQVCGQSGIPAGTASVSLPFQLIPTGP